MHLIMIGSEYAGKRTLAAEISKWMIESMGLSLAYWHSHYVVPHSFSSSTGQGGHLTVIRRDGRYVVRDRMGDVDVNAEEAAEMEEDVLALKPWLLEQLQRHMIWRHLHHSLYRGDDDYLVINFYYADAVYAPLYYGYGEPGPFTDRRRRARAWDAEVMGMAPDTVLVLVKASADEVSQRMRQSPRPRCVLKERDVPLVLDRFQEEYDNSLIFRRFTVDTTGASVEESFKQFLEQMWPYLSQVDRLRLVSRRDSL